MTREKLKQYIANIIDYDNNSLEDKSYEEHLQDIYDKQYRYILKVPTSVMFICIIERFTVKNLVDVDIIKEVIIDALEFGGTEVEFTDEDWNNLKAYDLGDWKNEPHLVLNTEKSFMMEFFEI